MAQCSGSRFKPIYKASVALDRSVFTSFIFSCWQKAKKHHTPKTQLQFKSYFYMWTVEKIIWWATLFLIFTIFYKSILEKSWFSTSKFQVPGIRSSLEDSIIKPRDVAPADHWIQLGLEVFSFVDLAAHDVDVGRQDTFRKMGALKL